MIAVQSAALGVSLCLVAMAGGAVGLLTPAAGALVQELIDVLAIGNALRALRPSRGTQVPGEARRLIDRFGAEHADLVDARSAVRRAPDALSGGLCPETEMRIRAGTPDVARAAAAARACRGTRALSPRSPRWWVAATGSHR